MSARALGAVGDRLPPLVRGVRGLVGPRPRTRQAVLSFQDACVRDLIQHACERVPYYRRLFEKAGLRAGDVRGVADLAAIPVTSREDLQHLPASEICASGWPLDSLRTVMTSGSTGAPLAVRRTMAEERLLLAYRVRALGSLGLGPRVRRAIIDHLHADGRRGDVGRRWLHGRRGIMPRLWIDWRRPTREILETLGRFRPDVICGPPSILSWLAADLADGDRRRVPGRLVLTGGETLTAQTRGQIERGFGLPVADLYGSHEVVFIALQPPGARGVRADGNGGGEGAADPPSYQVCEESVALEVLRDGAPVRPGESGEAVVTALHSFAMPFIRYRLGDRVRLAEAPGPYTALRSIDGRITGRFVLPDGRALLDYALGEAVEESGLGVRRFQVVQERRDAFRVALVLHEPPRGGLERLAGRLRDILGPGVSARVDVVAALEPGASRKFSPYVSYERLSAREMANAEGRH